MWKKKLNIPDDHNKHLQQAEAARNHMKHDFSKANEPMN